MGKAGLLPLPPPRQPARDPSEEAQGKETSGRLLPSLPHADWAWAPLLRAPYPTLPAHLATTHTDLGTRPWLSAASRSTPTATQVEEVCEALLPPERPSHLQDDLALTLPPLLPRRRSLGWIPAATRVTRPSIRGRRLGVRVRAGILPQPDAAAAQTPGGGRFRQLPSGSFWVCEAWGQMTSRVIRCWRARPSPALRPATQKPWLPCTETAWCVPGPGVVLGVSVTGSLPQSRPGF